VATDIRYLAPTILTQIWCCHENCLAAQTKYNIAAIGVKKRLISAGDFAGNFIGESIGYDVKSGTRD
jgi:hypothetical protein